MAEQWSKTEDGSDRVTIKNEDGSSRDITKERDGSITVTDHSYDGKSVTGDGATGIFGILTDACRLNER